MISGVQMVELLQPYTPGTLSQAEIEGFHSYLKLILQWNVKTNLTALRDPEALVQRQIGESLFASTLVPDGITILDFGSGAGFPGVPIQIMRPATGVTLAESQGKKASFLREVVRCLKLANTKVWAGRVEDLPSGEVFDWVAMRAVDRSDTMFPVAASRVAEGGRLLRFTGHEATAVDGWQVERDFSIPLSTGRLQVLIRV